ncbi:MAG: glycosyltransferase family 2 protein [Treponema sp.]|nr:glycosyltransferase family 2 protein [Treponema sp.]
MKQSIEQNASHAEWNQHAEWKPCFVIPVYNHGQTISAVVQSLESAKIPIIIVDDGNDESNRLQIEKAVNQSALCHLVRIEKNSGKGKAMAQGVLKASELGMSHAFQIDSDGQHDANQVPFFLEQSALFPECIICGYPEYDSSVPEIRKKAREISNKWARVCALSGQIVDAMCGFRIYPVAPYVELLRHHAWIDSRMGYDADVLVRLIWKGVNVKSHSVKVTYPKDGISNFRMVRDNLHISASFARLFLGMIIRLPFFALRKKK